MRAIVGRGCCVASQHARGISNCDDTLRGRGTAIQRDSSGRIRVAALRCSALQAQADAARASRLPSYVQRTHVLGALGGRYGTPPCHRPKIDLGRMSEVQPSKLWRTHGN